MRLVISFGGIYISDCPRSFVFIMEGTKFLQKIISVTMSDYASMKIADLKKELKSKVNRLDQSCLKSGVIFTE